MPSSSKTALLDELKVVETEQMIAVGGELGQQLSQSKSHGCTQPQRRAIKCLELGEDGKYLLMGSADGSRTMG